MADRFRICIIDIGSRDYGINIVILNDNIMKMKRTFITAFFAMLLVVFSVSCSSEEKEFDYAALPMSAQLFDFVIKRLRSMSAHLFLFLLPKTLILHNESLPRFHLKLLFPLTCSQLTFMRL